MVADAGQGVRGYFLFQGDDRNLAAALDCVRPQVATASGSYGLAITRDASANTDERSNDVLESADAAFPITDGQTPQCVQWNSSAVNASASPCERNRSSCCAEPSAKLAGTTSAPPALLPGGSGQGQSLLSKDAEAPRRLPLAPTAQSVMKAVEFRQNSWES